MCPLSAATFRMALPIRRRVAWSPASLPRLELPPSAFEDSDAGGDSSDFETETDSETSLGRPKYKYWWQHPPLRDRELIAKMVEMQLEYKPAFRHDKTRDYPPDYTYALHKEATHPLTEIFKDKAHVGEGLVRGLDYPFLSMEYEYADHVRMVVHVRIPAGARWRLCVLMVWSSGTWSWEFVGRFKTHEPYRVWMLETQLLPYLRSPRRVEAAKSLIRDSDPMAWHLTLQAAMQRMHDDAPEPQHQPQSQSMVVVSESEDDDDDTDDETIDDSTPSSAPATPAKPCVGCGSPVLYAVRQPERESERGWCPRCRKRIRTSYRRIKGKGKLRRSFEPWPSP